MTNTPRLETERLILRKFEEGDIEDIFLIFSDIEVNKYLPIYPFKNMDEARVFLEEEYLTFYKKNRGYKYAICLKFDNRPIGYVNLSNEDSHDFGYGLRKEFWNQGIVTEASKRVMAQLKVDGYPYITATHDINNIGSG